MPVWDQCKVPLRWAKSRLRESLFEHAGYYIQHNVTEAEIHSSGESFLISLCGRSWTRCFDVGAHQGDYARAVLAVNPFCEVTCFEPDSTLAKRLSDEMHDTHPKCRVVSSLVGDSLEDGVFHFNPERPSHSSMHSQTPLTQMHHKPQVTMDSYCLESQVSDIDCVKIDVEGHEFAVLRGMSRLISEERVGIIQFEYGQFSRQAGTSFRQVFDLLSPRFRLCHILPGGLLPVVYRSNIEKFDFSNWAAFSRKRFG